MTIVGFILFGFATYTLGIYVGARSAERYWEDEE